METSELLRIITDAAVFFGGCAVVFVTWVVVDVTAQARRASRTPPAVASPAES